MPTSARDAMVFAAIEALAPDDLRLAIKRGGSVFAVDSEGYGPIQLCAKRA